MGHRHMIRSLTPARCLAALAAVAALAALAALTACGGTPGDDASASPSPVPASTVVRTAADLAGDYPMTSNSVGGKELGVAVDLFADATYKWFGVSPYVPVSEGTFTIDGDMLTFTEPGAGVVQTLRVEGEKLIVDTGGQLAEAGDEYTRQAVSGQP